MTNLTRTLGFKTTEVVFQEVVTVANKMGLTKSDFVRNAVYNAIDKEESNSTTSFVADPVITPKPANANSRRNLKPGNLAELIEHRNKDLSNKIERYSGFSNFLCCIFLFI